jgi:predicted tellurium resistance membrane protein TerC
MEWIFDPNAWIALLTLTALEIVLGIDNIVFITILAGKLPPADQHRARRLGLAAAMITRILLLLSINWIMGLTQPWVTIFGNPLSGRDLILIVGGMFLIWKSTREIHEKVEGAEDHTEAPAKVSFSGVIVQIMLLDIVFSLDSVITAVGMADDVGVMITAVIVSVAIMMFAAHSVGDFVQRHPTVKMLALAFLILIGVNLMAEGWHFHIPKGYVYFAMAFSVFVEALNLRVSKKKKLAA